MKYRTRYALKDREKETRTVRKFLWIPRSFGVLGYGKWLCYADVVERVRLIHPWSYRKQYAWVEECFAEDFNVTPQLTRHDLAQRSVDLQDCLEGLMEAVAPLLDVVEKKGKITLKLNSDVFDSLSYEAERSKNTLLSLAETPDA